MGSSASLVGGFASGFAQTYMQMRMMMVERAYYQMMMQRMQQGNPATNAYNAGIAQRGSLIDRIFGGGNPVKLGDNKAAPGAASGPAADGAQSSQSSQSEPYTPPRSGRPRNVVNNNPGNIIDGPWAKSQPGYVGTDGKFAKFDSAENGFAALDKNLEAYGKQGLNTPAAIINKWAPSGDNNNPVTYAAAVGKMTGFNPNQPLDMSDPAVRQKLGQSIAAFEGGIPYGQVQAAFQPGAPTMLAGANPGTSAGTVDTVDNRGRPITPGPIQPGNPTPGEYANDAEGRPVVVNANGNAVGGPLDTSNPPLPPLKPADVAQTQAIPEATPQATPPPPPPPITPAVAQPQAALPMDDVAGYASGGPVDPSTGNPIYSFVDGMPVNPATAAPFISQATYADGGPVDDGDATTPPPPFLLPGTNQEVSDTGAPVGQVQLTPTNLEQPQAGDDEALDYSDPNVPAREDMETAAYGPGYAQDRMENAARHAGMVRMPSPMRGGYGGGYMPRGGIGLRMPYMRGGYGGGSEGPTPVGFSDPEVSNENGDLADMAVQAIQGGLHAIGHMLGLGGAINDDPSFPQKMHSFMRGDGRLSDDEVKQVNDVADPGDNLPNNMKNIAGLESMYRFYLYSGDPAKANMTAAAMLQASAYTSAKFGGEAFNLLHKGDVQGALNKMSDAYDAIPDGRTAIGTANPDGTATITQRNMNGDVIAEHTASPQEIWQAAIGLKNGTAAWGILEQAAGGTPKGGNMPISPNLARGLALLNGQQAPQTAQGPQGQPTQGAPTAAPQVMPATAQAPVTPGSNPPEQALPVQPASTGPQPAPQAAIPTGTGDLDQFTALQAAARARFGWQPQPPSFLTNPQWQPQTPQEQQLFQRVQAAKLKEWDAENNKRGAMADEYVKGVMLNDRQAQTQLNINTRQQAGETARMQMQEGLETQRARDQAEREEYRPLSPDDRSLAPEGQTTGDFAQSVTPRAFFPDQSPDGATQQFNAHFGQFGTQTANNVRDAVLMTARQSKMPMDSSAMAVRDIVLPSAASKDQLPFNMERVGPNKNIAHVTFNDGRDALMPMQTYTMLMKVRTAQVALMGQTQAAQSQRDSVQQDLNRREAAEGARVEQAMPTYGTPPGPSPLLFQGGPGPNYRPPVRPPASSALPVH